jgi:tetratricopeptide (TPR) repeat protein
LLTTLQSTDFLSSLELSYGFELRDETSLRGHERIRRFDVSVRLTHPPWFKKTNADTWPVFGRANWEANQKSSLHRKNKKTRNWIRGCPNQRVMTYPNKQFDTSYVGLEATNPPNPTRGFIRQLSRNPTPCGLGSVGAAVIGVLLSLSVPGCGANTPSRPSVAPNQSEVTIQSQREMVSRARQSMRRGDSIRAEHYYSLALEQGYDATELMPELLAVCLASSRLRSALNYAEPYLRKHPKDANLRYLVATVHLGLNQRKAAKQELHTVIRHDRSLADAYFLLAVLEYSTDRDTAKQYLNEYILLRPMGDKANEARELLEQATFDEKTEKLASPTMSPNEQSTSRPVRLVNVEGEGLK